ncbi:MAG: nitroreductase family protein [Bacteroidales bacterium]
MKAKIHLPIANRKSVLAFDATVLKDSDIRKLFEAARWAPSSYNEQPWRFYYASRDNAESFSKLASCLVPPNKEWAKNASMLVITTAKKHLALNGKKNGYAKHDTGLATANLLIQAESMGLATHPMGGFDRDMARTILNLNVDYIPVAAIAVGVYGNFDSLSEENKKREIMPRERKPLDEVAVKI